MLRIWPIFILLLFSLPTQAGREMYFLHNDHLGTPQVITDKNRQVVWKGHARPFGDTEVEVEAITNHRRFPGQRFDIESRLHYNYFRTYDPATGRYITSDPIGLRGGINTYAYVGNNPVNYIDPFGLYWFRQSWQKPGVVGRRDTIVPPGGPVSDFIERSVPAGYTFGEMHDAFVEGATNAGFPDWLVNIPSMIPMYGGAVGKEILRDLGILDQPTPPVPEPGPCE